MKEKNKLTQRYQMNKFDELLKQLNAQPIAQKEYPSNFWNDLPEDLYNEHFSNLTFRDAVAEDQELDKHKWYSRGTTVFQIYNRYLGVRGICETRGDGDISDYGKKYEFYEMEQVPAIIYKKKEVPND